jgi:hypothetical protein
MMYEMRMEYSSSIYVDKDPHVVSHSYMIALVFGFWSQRKPYICAIVGFIKQITPKVT